jgi:hypothetical protein
MEGKISIYGGKEILLKVIIHAIPIFAMEVFKIPKQLCKAINDAMARFCIGLHGGRCVFQKAGWDGLP